MTKILPQYKPSQGVSYYDFETYHEYLKWFSARQKYDFSKELIDLYNKFCSLSLF